MTTEIIRTDNVDWGFYGTWSRKDSGIDVDKAWDIAIIILLENYEEWTQEYARDFLDSRMGRHMADNVYEGVRFHGMALSNALRAAAPEFVAWYESVV